ncbi:hypothetical protein A5888_000512 [Enterococcus sp. 9E7_DIV0242]|uniref:Uncharacterized protein n=1 Tax=Candidatus Enterococcus clewellii TaxID=1834193 RepID=A0AAQ3VXB9_9ENTE
MAWISHHGATDDCGKWEHVLISLHGKTTGLPTFQQIKDSKQCFHPNCQHHVNVVKSLELVHPDILATTKKKLGKNM